MVENVELTVIQYSTQLLSKRGWNLSLKWDEEKENHIHATAVCQKTGEAREWSGAITQLPKFVQGIEPENEPPKAATGAETLRKLMSVGKKGAEVETGEPTGLTPDDLEDLDELESSQFEEEPELEEEKPVKKNGFASKLVKVFGTKEPEQEAVAVETAVVSSPGTVTRTPKEGKVMSNNNNFAQVLSQIFSGTSTGNVVGHANQFHALLTEAWDERRLVKMSYVTRSDNFQEGRTLIALPNAAEAPNYFFALDFDEYVSILAKNKDKVNNPNVPFTIDDARNEAFKGSYRRWKVSRVQAIELGEVLGAELEELWPKAAGRKLWLAPANDATLLKHNAHVRDVPPANEANWTIVQLS